MSLQITSPKFSHQGEMPAKYTCQGENISPPLSWSGIPAGTKSLVLIIDDPDAPDPKAPKMTWDHWIIYNLSPELNGIAENTTEASLGALSGTNSWNKTAYGGPCPPIGKHRYFHKLYALDTKLDDLKHPTKDKLLSKMDGHILAQAELVGLYQKH